MQLGVLALWKPSGSVWLTSSRQRRIRPLLSKLGGISATHIEPRRVEFTWRTPSCRQTPTRRSGTAIIFCF
jgi:hypothetical protein